MRRGQPGRTTQTKPWGAPAALVALALGAALAGCGPKTLAEFQALPEVGYDRACAEKATAHRRAREERRYLPNTLFVARWPKELPGGKQATLADVELARRLLRGEVRRLLVSARGGVGKSTLAGAIEASTCGEVMTFRVDLNADVAARLGGAAGGNAVLAAIERVVGVDRDVDRQQTFRELVRGAPTLLLLDAIEEVPLADRAKVVAQVQALLEQMPQMRMVLFARPAVFDTHYGFQGFDAELAMPPLECNQAKAVLRWNAPDRDHHARAEQFIRTYQLDRQTVRRDRCLMPYLAGYRDVQVVARMAETFEPKDAAAGFSANLAQVHETIVGERLRKELAALDWPPAQALAALDALVRIEARDDGGWNLVFDVPRCLKAVEPLVQGEVKRQYVCEKMLQSMLFDRLEGEAAWRFDHQEVADLFLARWLDRELGRFGGDCEVVDKHAAWIGQRSVGGYLLGQPAGRSCAVQVAAAVCAARDNQFERGMGDLLYMGLPMGAERRKLVEDAGRAVARWKKAPDCVKRLIGAL